MCGGYRVLGPLNMLGFSCCSRECLCQGFQKDGGVELCMVGTVG
jgi:hypothetical protein